MQRRSIFISLVRGTPLPQLKSQGLGISWVSITSTGQSNDIQNSFFIVLGLGVVYMSREVENFMITYPRLPQLGFGMNHLHGAVNVAYLSSNATCALINVGTIALNKS